MVFIKIGYEGKSIKEYALSEGVRVVDVLTAAGIMLTMNERVFLYSSNHEQSMDNIVLDRSILVIKKPNVTQVKCSRIGQTLITANVVKTNTVLQTLLAVGLAPRPTEEIWMHFDGVEKGTLVTCWEQVITPNAIYVVEPRKTLQNKIERIIRDCNNADFSEEAIANTICVLLTKEYNIR